MTDQPHTARKRYGRRLTSTFPTVTSPLPHSATTSPRHAGCCCCCCPFPRCCSASSADGAGGTIFHTLTHPSRCPLAIKWYDLPHAGAQEREVIACEPRPWAAVPLLGVPLEVMDAEGVGDGWRTRRAEGVDAERVMSWQGGSVSDTRKRLLGTGTNLDDPAVSARRRQDLSPPPLLAPTQTPTTERLVALARIRRIHAGLTGRARQ